MRIVEASSYDAMSEAGADLLHRRVREKPDSLVCIASGGSPAGMYAEVARRDLRELENIRLIALDEWCGIPSTHPATCAAYIHRHVYGPWGITNGHIKTFDADATDPVTECERMAEWLKENGPIDLCILGLGRNGHLGLNEPGCLRDSRTRVVDLHPVSAEHGMLKSAEAAAYRGMTLGIADILASRQILLLVTGDGKADAFHAFMEKKPAVECPAGFLWEHRNATCIVDRHIKGKGKQNKCKGSVL